MFVITISMKTIKFNMDEVTWDDDNIYTSITDFTIDGLIGNFKENAEGNKPILLIKEYKKNEVNKYAYILTPISDKINDYNLDVIYLNKFIEESSWYEYHHDTNDLQILTSEGFGFIMTPVLVEEIETELKMDVD
jgi:hypothetical protein